ncbi:MAG: SCO family protein [Pseudomonadota bacterium]
MNPQIKKRLLRTAVLSFLALCVGIGVGYVQVRMENARSIPQGSEDDPQGRDAMKIAGLNIGGPFSLTNHLGEDVTEKNYEGQHKIIYFGFTYCPAICPTELQKMSRIVSALEKNYPEAAENIQPLFITIDPERDRVPVMREYVRLFHPRLVGLTGTQPQIDFVKKSYRVFASKVEDETMNDYTMDHSSFLYLMSPDNKLMTMYRINDTADEIYADIEKQLAL